MEKIRKGDQVVVLSGRDKGRRGAVLRVGGGAVLVERLVRHETYGKFLRRSTKLLAHDESNSAREGDTVTITPCRPLSRRKSWRLLAIIERAAP